MPEGYRHSAGGGDKLKVVRYGREQMSQRELPNGTGGTIYPGEALMVTTDGNGDPVFDYHDGNEETALYVAEEARGRGMDAQTDDGYADGEGLTAQNPAGGGLNLQVADGEDIVDGDSLIPGVDTGNFIEVTTEGWSVAFADETSDLTGASSPALVATEVSQ